MKVWAVMWQDFASFPELDVAFCDCLGATRAFDLQVFAGATCEEEGTHSQVCSVLVGVGDGKFLHHLEYSEADGFLSLWCWTLTFKTGILP